jgi:gamma-glutamylcyclotransferase (GGCT)/AIG2-like uncharacterized protein YtfP
MFPQVWQRVVRGQYRSANAIVANHARYAITAETYPAMVRQHGNAVSGVLYFDVEEIDTQTLDEFESTDYRREKVLATLDTGELLEAETYIYLDKTRLTPELWRPETFQLQHFLDTYCQMHRAK